MRRVTPGDIFAKDILCLAYADRIESMTKFRAMIEGWTLGYLRIGDAVAGVAGRRNGELHIGVLPEWRGRWATRQFIRDILAWAAQSGPVTTGVMADNEKGKRLVEGVGFVPVESNERGTRYDLSTDAI